jgi:NTP pyrophosphatase (non-canonical NTP hydrolase)
MWDVSDPGLWSLILTLGTLLGTLAFRKRIGKAIGRMIFRAAPQFIDEFLWEEVEEVVEAGPKGGITKKIKVKHLRKEAADQLKALAPIAIQAGLQGIAIDLPKNLPINPQTGQIDLLAPVASKLMSGKKITGQDLIMPFLPTIMELTQGLGAKLGQAVQGFMQKGPGPAAAAEGQALSPAAQKILEGALMP